MAKKIKEPINPITWMNPKYSMLCDRSQTQKSTYNVIPFT